ncbi:IDEAL domain-containing protein [Bacillus sp. KH172YL63]|uniref:IDEAL domain-containing protein n=1 Tax=Bacillus sp. KH172YL63 TaxID=2709784 RepID=UPI0013E50F57|nr:IDEAL domain-containing protein [Bacillus sp. KH172YL63]BCB03943.1 hypothetical protein KH172YL63_20760 [Bacillus sp. KH172YL63]
MKKHLLNSPQGEVRHLYSLFAEMVLEKSLMTFRKEQILEGIDDSLCNRNKEKFLRLTEELKYL